MSRTATPISLRRIGRLLPPWIANPIRGIGAAGLAPLLFSYRTGHFRSSLKRMAVARGGEPLPWYSYPCIDFLSRRPFTDRIVLEFGGGQSTLWWARRASRVVTFEGDRAWYHRIAATMPSNVELHHVSQDSPAVCTQQVEEVLRRGRHAKYDVIVIDGLWRTELVDIAARYVADDGMIICDDAHGYGIQEAFQTRGLNRVDFFGYHPGAVSPSVTSIYFRPDSFGFSATHAIPLADRCGAGPTPP